MRVQTLELEPTDVAKRFFDEILATRFISRDITRKYGVDYPIRKDQMIARDSKLIKSCRVFSGWANVNKLRDFIENGCKPIEEPDGVINFFLSENGVIYYRKERAKARNILSVLRNLGTTELMRSELERMGLTYSYPKPKELISYVVQVGSNPGDLIFDFFAGSGTTGHAVINLNREDGGARKYILVEMGEYFDTVLVPRLKKVVYATDWKGGKPQSRDTGISHAFKIVRLEGYEDTLNNLRLVRTPEQQATLNAAPEEARDGYLISYFLDVESTGSASLLDFDQFRDPFSYKLKIATASAGETKETTIDLVETFNWLLGLKVKHIDTQKGFLTVTGEKRAGGRTLVIWRTLGDDPVKDNEALDKFLARLQINPADTEFDFIYVNGSHTLADQHNKVHLIEETFARLMFEAQDFETLSQ